MYLVTPRLAVPHFWTFVILKDVHESGPVGIQSQIDATTEIDELQGAFILS